jgi:hypothetical protein
MGAGVVFDKKTESEDDIYVAGFEDQMTPMDQNIRYRTGDSE